MSIFDYDLTKIREKFLVGFSGLGEETARVLLDLLKQLCEALGAKKEFDIIVGIILDIVNEIDKRDDTPRKFIRFILPFLPIPDHIKQLIMIILETEEMSIEEIKELLEGMKEAERTAKGSYKKLNYVIEKNQDKKDFIANYVIKFTTLINNVIK